MVAIAFLLFAILLMPFLKGTYFYNKLVEGTQWELAVNINKPNTDKDHGADSRMSRWLVSSELIRERPLFGYGTGAGRELLSKAYKGHNMHASIRQGYDSHNQYLGYAINYGLVGFAFLFVFFVINFVAAFRKRDLARFLFFFLIGSLCLTENYLIRNMGINFVALFGSLYYYRHD
jgi:O-antigen ligase